MSAHTHRLQIAGHVVTVRSPADTAYVRALAADLDARVRAVGDQGAGPVGAVLVAALGLADELRRAQDALAAAQATAATRDAELLAQVERALSE
ncbi:MAG: cell division protein ZapA [Myxococcales bacterium]|nr:cell division protein ZapA [Myxococcales bacterium]